MKLENMEKTAFAMPFRLYEFDLNPQSLANSIGTFQRFMQSTLHGLSNQIWPVYLDDILLYYRNYQQRFQNLEIVVQR